MNRTRHYQSLVCCRILLICGGMLLLAGCSTGERKSQFAQEIVRDEVPVMVLRAESFRFLEQFTKKVENTADQIILLTDDPAIKRNALTWKIYAIPECMTAQDNPSPLAGLVDMWVLALQMHDFFNEGQGSAMFGPHQPLAVQTSEALLTDAEEAARYFLKSEGFDRITAKATEFAAANPLDGTNFERPFSSEEMQSILSGADAGLFSVAQNLEIEVLKMQVKLGYYAELLPRIARWQAELFTLDFMTEQVEPTIAETWNQLAEERETILKDVNRQREETQTFAAEQKLHILEHITRERQALTQDIERLTGQSINDVEEFAQNEMQRLREFFDQQRELALEAVREERDKTMEDMERISKSSVDHAYSKLWPVLVVAWFGVAGLLMVARLLFRPSKNSAQTR